MKKKIINCITIMIIILFITSAIFFVIKTRKNKIIKQEIKETKLPIVEKNTISIEKEISNLKIKFNNEDIIGIVTIPDTELNTPITKTINNYYYLSHSLAKNNSIIGSVFADYRHDSSSKQINLYGHNSTLYDPPFKILEKYLDDTFYRSHQIIQLKINNELRTYEIFSVAIVNKVETEEHMNFNYQTNTEWLNHFNRLKQKSIYEYNKELTTDDKIIVLQTCLFGKYYEKLIIVIGKQINV